MDKKGRIGVLLLAGVIPCFMLGYPIELRSEDAAKGKASFDSICAACHTIGGGVKVGPDLKDITDQRSGTWLTSFISDPAKVIKSGDPVANSLLKKFNGLEMPTLGLSPEQVSDLLAYLKSTAAPGKGQAPPVKSTGPSPAPAPVQGPTPSQAPQPVPVQAPTPEAQTPAAQAPGPPAAALPSGSAETGEQLFSGLISFQKGGPPCLSCHDVARLSFPGGGTLGPDLTGAFAKYGAAGMRSTLATLPFPTMRPIFGHRPLTPQEQQDLEAFLQKAGVQSLVSRGVEVAMAALGGLIILIILAWIIWQNRIVPIRRALVNSVRREH